MARVMRVRVSPTAPSAGVSPSPVKAADSESAIRRFESQRILNPPFVGSNPTTPAIALIRLMKRPRRKVSGFFHAYFPDLPKQNGQKKRVRLFRPSEHCCSSLGLIDRIAGFVVSRSLDCGLFFHFTSHFASALGKRFGHTGRGGRSLRAEEVKDGDYRKEHGTGGR